MALCGRPLDNEVWSCLISFSDTNSNVQKTSKVCCNGLIHGSNQKCCFSGSVVRNSSEIFNDWMNTRKFFTTPTLLNILLCFEVSNIESDATDCHLYLVRFCLVCFSFLTFYILTLNFHYAVVIISILLEY